MIWDGAWFKRGGRCFLLVCSMLAGNASLAHPTLDSQILLDIQPDLVRAALSMPLLDLLAAQPDLAPPAGEGLPKLEDLKLRRYVSAHLRGLAIEGQSWETRVLDWELASPQSPDQPTVVVVNALLQPGRLPFERLTLQADFITHEVHNHSILVSLRSDWDGGLAAQPPVLLGSLSHERSQLEVNRHEPQPFAAWRSFVYLGAAHILAGYDHLLFLALMLIAASLVQKDGQWVQLKRPAAALRSAMGIITAFTVGHSVTLALCAVGGLSFSTQWVESLVALSIVVSALHLFRPLIPGREAWVAGSFGLIHGLAFAQALDVLHLAMQDRIFALLGFNLGIELMQIALTLTVMPVFYLTLCHPAHVKVRKLMACVALALGMIWFMQHVVTPGI